MRIAVIGGTGFVGGYLVEALVDAGHSVSAIVRSGSEDKIRRSAEVSITTGNLSSQRSIDQTCADCDAVIYNVGILREFPSRGITFEETQFLGVQRTIAAAKKTGVSRFLLMSANGVRLGGTPYQKTKYAAEELARNSDLNFTIFRPAVIFGDPHGLLEIATQLHRDMVLSPLPAVGFHTGWNPARGSIMMSPVHVEDVAQAFVSALKDDTLSRQTVHLGGPEALSWSTMIERIAAATGRKKTILPMPVGMMKLAALVMDWIPQFPVTRDQLTMLAEGNVAEPDELIGIIGRDPQCFDAESLAYLTK